MLIFLTIFALTMGSVTMLDYVACTLTIDTTEEIPVPYTSTIKAWSTIQPMTGYIMGYYINPHATPISKINFTTLKDAGITDIYVLVDNENYLSVLGEAKSKADTVGIRTTAWVFPGFKHANEVAQMKIGVQLDVETYDMPSYVSQIKVMRGETRGVPFSVCAKPEKWDGNQYYHLIAPHCDYIVPMLYLADYDVETRHLKVLIKFYNYMYPGKIVAALQTYRSDQDLTPKDENHLLAEVRAVQHYTGGVILFRYGLSKFHS